MAANAVIKPQSMQRYAEWLKRRCGRGEFGGCCKCHFNSKAPQFPEAYDGAEGAQAPDADASSEDNPGGNGIGDRERD
jgi:hypothetical protein